MPGSDSGEQTRGRRPAGRLDDWTAELAEVLGAPDAPVDIALLLDVARDVAHAVDRPAVPITLFLLGYASAQQGGTDEVVEARRAQVEQLAAEWARRDGKPGPA